MLIRSLTVPVTSDNHCLHGVTGQKITDTGVFDATDIARTALRFHAVIFKRQIVIPVSGQGPDSFVT